LLFDLTERRLEVVPGFLRFRACQMQAHPDFVADRAQLADHLIELLFGLWFLRSRHALSPFTICLHACCGLAGRRSGVNVAGGNAARRALRVIHTAAPVAPALAAERAFESLPSTRTAATRRRVRRCNFEF